METGGELRCTSDASLDADNPSDSDGQQNEQQVKRWLANASEKAINERLQKAIEEENYEYAKLCQEELKRRKEGGA